MKTATTIASLLAVLLVNGCVGVMPVPHNSNTLAVGHAVTREKVKFIVPGQTTRAEVVAKLGLNFRESPRMPVIAYSWERPAAGFVWWLVFVGPYNGVAGGGEGEGNYWSAFFVKYDSDDRVQETKFVHLSNDHSLDEQMEKWAASEGDHFVSSGMGVFNPATGKPKLFEWMKNNGRFTRF